MQSLCSKHFLPSLHQTQVKLAKQKLEFARNEQLKADAIATHISESVRKLNQLVDSANQTTKKLIIAKDSIVAPQQEAAKSFEEMIKKEVSELEEEGLDIAKMVSDAQKLLDAAKAFEAEWLQLLHYKRDVDYEVASQRQSDAEYAIESELIKLDESLKEDLLPLVEVLPKNFAKAPLGPVE